MKIVDSHGDFQNKGDNVIVTKTRTLGPQGNALQAEQQVGGNPVGATILIASDRHLEPEPERPIRLQVVAGPCNHRRRLLFARSRASALSISPCSLREFRLCGHAGRYPG